jgi:hypothetical protein
MPRLQLQLVRPHETYYVNERDEIYRPFCPGGPLAPSGDWRLLGAVEYRTVFGRTVKTRRYSTEDIRAGRVPWLWKNGKQRCYVVDYDHGTRRMWASPTGYYSRLMPVDEAEAS